MEIGSWSIAVLIVLPLFGQAIVCTISDLAALFKPVGSRLARIVSYPSLGSGEADDLPLFLLQFRVCHRLARQFDPAQHATLRIGGHNRPNLVPARFRGGKYVPLAHFHPQRFVV